MTINKEDAEAWMREKQGWFREMRIDYPVGNRDAESEFGYILEAVRECKVNYLDLDYEGKTKIVLALVYVTGSSDLAKEILTKIIDRDAGIIAYSDWSKRGGSRFW